MGKTFPLITQNFGHAYGPYDKPTSFTCVRNENIPLKKNNGMFQNITTCQLVNISGDGCKKCPQENAIFTGLDCEFTCKDGYSKDGLGEIVKNVILFQMEYELEMNVQKLNVILDIRHI